MVIWLYGYIVPTIDQENQIAAKHLDISCVGNTPIPLYLHTGGNVHISKLRGDEHKVSRRARYPTP